ncbi:DNA recombination protein RmuC [Alteromonas aestuariivivens]|uniref:DNA recombination protein RmuC n=1 Tax=Alteromonas aestuariivivens TaxID=1938339 RepID=A0A3D8M847_9ALTE|nr:DNA recombination protein RmuC [Alteromonas aestuariivivens]RDV25994.1 DNA recombination protein RmuC [Alteromonas aestuariivivens]
MMIAVDLVHVLFALAGVLLGALVAGLLVRRKLEQALAQATSQLDYQQSQLLQSNQELQQGREQILGMQSQLGELNQKAHQLSRSEQDCADLRAELKTALAEQGKLQARLDAQAASFAEANKASEEKLALMASAEQRLQTQFENLANRIFEQKSETFSKLNKTGLDALLNPLKDQIEGFKRQVNDQYVREGQERASLKTEILTLKELNQKITEEASALTKALKGDNKQQGNWGEVVLERILKESGLREGHEFETQVSARSDEGKLQQPDVVVHLPNDKDVIIDSKVSLSAYERFFNATDENERQRLLNEHVASLRNHIKGLGSKDYHELKGLKTLDYVLMFIPIEPAFLLAVEEDPGLVSLALNHNIMLVSPTNLLVALRTINNIWQYEYQNQNAQKIAQHAAKLYDKFSGFVGDMEKIGRALETTQKHYDGALSKLSSGRGNMVRQIEQFRKLGVQPSKKLPDSVTSQYDEDDTSE